MKNGSAPSATSPAVRSPAGDDRGGVDFEARVAVDDAAQRLAEPGRARPGIGDVVMLAVMFERRLAGEHLADDRDVFAGAGQRPAERHAVPALDDLRPRRADAAEEAVAGERLQRQRGHRRAGRGARRHLHDAGAGLDPAGARQHPGDRA